MISRVRDLAHRSSWKLSSQHSPDPVVVEATGEHRCVQRLTRRLHLLRVQGRQAHERAFEDLLDCRSWRDDRRELSEVAIDQSCAEQYGAGVRQYRSPYADELSGVAKVVTRRVVAEGVGCERDAVRARD